MSQSLQLESQVTTSPSILANGSDAHSQSSVTSSSVSTEQLQFGNAALSRSLLDQSLVGRPADRQDLRSSNAVASRDSAASDEGGRVVSSPTFGGAGTVTLVSTGTAIDSSGTDTSSSSNLPHNESVNSSNYEATSNVDTSSFDAVLQSVASAPPTAAAQALSNAVVAMPEIQAREKDSLKESFPEVERPTGLPRVVGGHSEVPGDLQGGQPPDLIEVQGREGAPPEIESIVASGPLPSKLLTTQVEEPQNSSEASWWDSVFSQVQAFMASVPTHDPALSTHAGPRPSVDLTGDANPEQNSQNKTLADADVCSWQFEAADAVRQDFGESSIYPDVPEETLVSSYESSSPPDVVITNMSSTDGAPLPDVSMLDQPIGPWYSEQVEPQRERQRTERETYLTTSEEIRDDGECRIDEATDKTRAEQETMQEVALSDVDGARTRWQQENERIRQDYSTQAESRKTEVDQQIGDQVCTAEVEADQRLTEAETEATAEQQKAEDKAAEEKQKLENKPRSWWERAKGAVSSALDAIKATVNAIFDGLRALVKGIFELAKRVVRGIIELARAAVVSLIREFGNFLKGLITIALAAFPEAAARARAWIDRRIDQAVEAVNRAAEALKRATDAILDFVAGALDAALSILQKVNSAILGVLSFVINGLMEVIDGIVRLASSAALIGDYFLGQLEEEGLGVDLTQPLPIEKRAAEATVDSVAMPSGLQRTMTDADTALLGKSRLDDSDVMASNVAAMCFEPELLASLPPLREGEEFHFGQNELPENQREAILASALEPQTLDAVAAENVATGATAEPEAADPSRMTIEQQLEYLEAQEIPHTCEAQKEEEPAQEGDLPDHMRIYGPFEPAHRFRYMWGQIKKGISQWWSCNWGKVVAAFAVGALVAILLGILTGGAIFSAIPPLMEIVAAILVGVALVRATSYVGDYLTKAWKGDLVGGAKALARGFAILLIELIFALLFNIGSVIKAVKSGVTGTVKAATGAAKTALRSTKNAIREVGQVSKTAIKASIKNSKLIVAGFRNGFGEGIRTVGELTRQMLRKTRFRGFYFRLRGRVLELWGRFNADVKLGEQRVQVGGAKSSLEQAEDILESVVAVGDIPVNRTVELVKAGDDLFVGTYGRARRANRQTGLSATHTPHHSVQNAVASTSHSTGVTINLRKDLHALTRTFRRPVEEGLTLRQHLAKDIRDIRNILIDAGYDRRTINAQLQELIRQNKAMGGFGK